MPISNETATRFMAASIGQTTSLAEYSKGRSPIAASWIISLACLLALVKVLG